MARKQRRGQKEREKRSVKDERKDGLDSERRRLITLSISLLFVRSSLQQTQQQEKHTTSSFSQPI